jgi:hypothetical protein
MIEEAIQTSRETLRVSVRPIKGKMHAVLKFRTENGEPECMKPYRGLTHSQCLEELDREEWNWSRKGADIRAIYDRGTVQLLYQNRQLFEAFCTVYVAAFNLLQHFLMRKFQSYLSTERKWKVFSGRSFEGANESSLIELCYFFDIISAEQADTIEMFRRVRNERIHSLTPSKYDANQERIAFESMLDVLDSLVSHAGMP